MHESPIKFKMFRGKTVLYVLSGAQWRMKYIFDSISLGKKAFFAAYVTHCSSVINVSRLMIFSLGPHREGSQKKLELFRTFS